MFRANPYAPEFLLPFFLSRPQAGFPSPADEVGGWSLDLNSYVVEHPESTFFVRIEGDSMAGAGIFSGDMLVVDKAREPSDGRIVLAVVDGAFTVRRLTKRAGKRLLVSDPPHSGWSGERRGESPVELTSDTDCFVWGVVVGTLRKF